MKFVIDVETKNKKTITQSDIATALKIPQSSVSAFFPKGVFVASLPFGIELPNITVCVTCHSAYISMLPRQIAAIDNQTVKPFEKILALDGCEKPDFVPDDWRVLVGDHGNPNPLRNAAAVNTKAEWIIYADADDEMHPEYLRGAQYSAAAASPSDGIIYADLKYSSGREIITPPVFDYWKLREKNYISACSAWRVSAIAEAGGWPLDTKCFDDYSLALTITRLGWKAVKNLVPILVNIHRAGHRSAENSGVKSFPHLWKHRTYGIVSLLAGRDDCFDDWKNFLLKADLPPQTALYVLDNSGKRKFAKKVLSFLNKLAYERDIKTFYHGYGTPDLENDKSQSRNTHVAYLYNRILPQVNDDFLVMLEDDVVPPLDGLQKLASAWDYKAQMGAVGGVYFSRHNVNGSQRIIASRHETHWIGPVYLKEVSEDRLYEFNQIAGGFTLWNNAYVKNSLPCRYDFFENLPRGWDTNMSVAVRKQNTRLFLHGGVYCEHNTQGGKNETK